MNESRSASPEDRAAVSRRIRAELCARGWSIAELAARMAASKSVVVNLIAGGSRARASRLRLELVMERAFWSSPADLAACRPVAVFYGGRHPRTLNLRKLDALAAEHLRPAGVRGRLRPRAALVARLEAHAARQSSLP